MSFPSKRGQVREGSLDQYLKEISQYPLIDRNEEVRLAQAIRRGEEEALNKLVRQMVKGRGRVSETDIEDFLAAGYTRQQFFEVIIGVCVKTFSNYVSIGLELELDAAFQIYAWEGTNAKATNQGHARK